MKDAVESGPERGLELGLQPFHVVPGSMSAASTVEGAARPQLPRGDVAAAGPPRVAVGPGAPCEKCGAMLKSANATSCGTCGAQSPAVRAESEARAAECQSCHAKLKSAEAKVCRTCGAKTGR